MHDAEIARLQRNVDGGFARVLWVRLLDRGGALALVDLDAHPARGHVLGAGGLEDLLDPARRGRQPSPPSRTVEFVPADLDPRRAAFEPRAGGAPSA